MAIAGSGGWVPCTRVSIYNKEMHLGIMHNVPPEVANTAEQAAAILIANPKAMPYVDRAETVELWYLLYLADLVEPQDKVYVLKDPML